MGQLFGWPCSAVNHHRRHTREPPRAARWDKSARDAVILLGRRSDAAAALFPPRASFCKEAPRSSPSPHCLGPRTRPSASREVKNRPRLCKQHSNEAACARRPRPRSAFAHDVKGAKETRNGYSVLLAAAASSFPVAGARSCSQPTTGDKCAPKKRKGRPDCSRTLWFFFGKILALTHRNRTHSARGLQYTLGERQREQTLFRR